MATNGQGAGQHDYHEIGEELERRLRLSSYPLAIKLLENEASIPEGALRPRRDLGHRLWQCQAYQMSRRGGTTVAMLAQDQWCFEPVVGYGLEEGPAAFYDGYNRYPRDVVTLDAGRHYAEDFPRLEVGKYVGVVSAPLNSTPFEPDLITIYCDSTQLSLLLLAREWKDGHDLKCSLSSHAACVYGVVPPFLSGECQIAVPCRGDHWVAFARHDEIILTIPRNKLADLMMGLRYVAETGSKLPSPYYLSVEHPLPECYTRIAEGMSYFKPR